MLEIGALEWVLEAVVPFRKLLAFKMETQAHEKKNDRFNIEISQVLGK